MLLLVASFACKQLVMPPRAYYAVRKGRCTGIYNSWAETKLQVSGYSAASFKKFHSERDAIEFINGVVSTSAEGRNNNAAFKTQKNEYNSPDESYYIYTDGSCRGNSNVANNVCRAGWGVVVTKRTPGIMDYHETLVDELYGPVFVDSASPYFLGAEYGQYIS